MTLAILNSLSDAAAAEELTRCCGSPRWVGQMIARRPFLSDEELLQIADNVWWGLSEYDWKAAFTHHPKIGDIGSLRRKFAATAIWASYEQAGATHASDEVLAQLEEGNRKYEEKFGYIFIVCATGKSADEMLGILTRRLNNFPDEEIQIAAAEQAKITRLRLEKLLAVQTEEQ